MKLYSDMHHLQSLSGVYLFHDRKKNPTTKKITPSLKYQPTLVAAGERNDPLTHTVCEGSLNSCCKTALFSIIPHQETHFVRRKVFIQQGITWLFFFYFSLSPLKRPWSGSSVHIVMTAGNRRTLYCTHLVYVKQ